MRAGATTIVVAYRLRRTFPRRWPAYLGIVLLVGVIGGLAMGSIAAARRTQSSFATFLASSRPSDLTVAVFPTATVASGSQGGYSPQLTRLMRHLPGVERVASAVQPFGLPLGADGRPRTATLSDLTVLASNGLYFDMDRPGVLQGRMASANSPDEFVTTASGAQLSDWHVGQVVPFGFYTVAQISSPKFGTAAVRPVLTLRATLVGIVQFSDSVVQDEVDRYPTFAVFPPALTRQLLARGSTFATYYGVQTVRGPADVSSVEQAFARRAPNTAEYQIHVTSLVAARTDRAIKPESIALGVFGVIAALAALTIAGQAVGRFLRAGQGELEVLRELGASTPMTIADGLLGALLAIVLGAAVAFALAVALSPIGPIGPVRPVYPAPGFALDWTVLGVGVAVIVGVLGLFALGLAYRQVPHRVSLRRRAFERSSTVATVAAAAGLPAPAVTGVRFALEPGDGRAGVPVRSALLSTVVAIVVVVGTLTFGSGFSTLLSHPPLYGWNWNYALFSETGPDVPPQAANLLASDARVAGVSYATSADPLIDGRYIPALFERADAAVVPPITSGHEPRTNHQIVLGTATMEELGTHLGGMVTVTYGNPKAAPLYLPPVKLRVVGTATFPALGFPSSEGDHTSMGTGALVPSGLISASFVRAEESPDPVLNGPEFVLVRMRPGVSSSAGQADMRRIALAGNEAFAKAPNGDGTGDTVLVFSDLLPAEIVDYRSIGATPALLAGSLAVGATVALALTLVASVRRRRRDLALLKALGFTGNEVTASVIVQATVLGVLGLVVGIPVGIAVGRWLWILFAHQISAVPEPTVPVLALVVVGVIALVLVNVVAFLPGRAAARTPTAWVLRAE